MRRNQISIHVERFGDQAPEGAEKQSISVYADANNIFEALSAAYYRLMDEIKKARVFHPLVVWKDIRKILCIPLPQIS